MSTCGWNGSRRTSRSPSVTRASGSRPSSCRTSSSASGRPVPARHACAGGRRDLGLAISRHLAELQGARIFVDSDGLGKGSTFTVEFPIESADARPAEVARPHTPAEPEPVSLPDLAGVRVLAVDDDPDSLALAREVLESTGAEVVTTGSGEDALKRLGVRQPGCAARRPRHAIHGRVRADRTGSSIQ